MASHDGQTKTNTENTGAESVKEFKQNQSPGVVDTTEGPLAADGEPVCKKPKLSDVTQDEIRIVLVGKTGVGKSNLGNSLLGSPVFVVSAHMTSETSNCSRKQKSTLTLIDTPGLFDTTKSNEESQKAIVECINLSRPGPHVFIIVVSLASRFTPEDQQTIGYIEQIFGEKSRDFMIVVFTSKHCSDLPIDDTWVKHPGQEPLKSLLEKCNYRYSSIDNKGEKVEDDVKAILELIKQTIKDNNNKFYTGEMYDEAAILYMKYLKEKKEKEEKLERLEKEKEELRERLEKEKKEKDELKIQHAELERKNKEQEEKGEKLERLEKENEKLRAEKEEISERLGKEKEEMEKKYEQKIQNLENEQLKANKSREEVKNIPSTSYDVQRIPKGYFHDSRTVGIPSQALIKESSRSEVTDYDYIQLKSYVFTTKESKIKTTQRGRGRMPDKEYDIIQSNYTMLLNSIQPDVLCQALFEKGVFDVDDLEQIKKEESKGRRAVTEKLLQCLLTRGPEAFGKFMICLRQTGHDGILKQLQSALEEERKTDKGPTKVMDKTLLLTNMPKLLQILADPDVILNSLLARGVFTAKDIEMIKKEIQKHDKQAGIMKLFSTLQECGPDAFQLFGECLKEQGYAEAMELLQLNVDVKTGEEEKNEEEKREENKGTRGRDRGPMKEPDRTTLKKNIPELLRIINEPDLILESLCARDVFDRTDREKVERQTRENGNRAGVTKLLNLVLGCGSDALQPFKSCLRECGYNQALELLGFNTPTRGSSSVATVVAKSMSTKEKPRKSQVVTETNSADEEVFQGEDRLMEEQYRHRQISMETIDVKSGEEEKKTGGKKDEMNEEVTKETKKEKTASVGTKKEEKGSSLWQKFRYKNTKTQEKKEEAKELEPNRLSNITDVYNANKDRTDPTPDKGYQREPQTDLGMKVNLMLDAAEN